MPSQLMQEGNGTFCHVCNLDIKNKDVHMTTTDMDHTANCPALNCVKLISVLSLINLYVLLCIFDNYEDGMQHFNILLYTIKTFQSL